MQKNNNGILKFLIFVLLGFLFTWAVSHFYFIHLMDFKKAIGPS